MGMGLPCTSVSWPAMVWSITACEHGPVARLSTGPPAGWTGLGAMARGTSLLGVCCATCERRRPTATMPLPRRRRWRPSWCASCWTALRVVGGVEGAACDWRPSMTWLTAGGSSVTTSFSWRSSSDRPSMFSGKGVLRMPGKTRGGEGVGEGEGLEAEGRTSAAAAAELMVSRALLKSRLWYGVPGGSTGPLGCICGKRGGAPGKRPNMNAGPG